jgi:predicted AAA+ superfamily ATPase
MGMIIPTYSEFDISSKILQEIVNDIITKDIIKRYNIRTKTVFIKLTDFIFNELGKRISNKNLENFLVSKKEEVVNQKTILKFFSYLCNSLMLCDVVFFNIKGKEKLVTKTKYYAGDLGIANVYKGFDIEKDFGYRLENLVYLELLSRDYEVYTSLDRNELEVDFVAKKGNEIKYVQVCKELNNENYERESKSLLKIKDGYEKIIISYENNVSPKLDGIKQVNLCE